MNLCTVPSEGLREQGVPVQILNAGVEKAVVLPVPGRAELVLVSDRDRNRVGTGNSRDVNEEDAGWLPTRVHTAPNSYPSVASAPGHVETVGGGTKLQDASHGLADFEPFLEKCPIVRRPRPCPRCTGPNCSIIDEVGWVVGWDILPRIPTGPRSRWRSCWARRSCHPSWFQIQGTEGRSS